MATAYSCPISHQSISNPVSSNHRQQQKTRIHQMKVFMYINKCRYFQDSFKLVHLNQQQHKTQCMLVNCGTTGNIICQRTLGFITSFPDSIPSLDIIVTSYSTISELTSMFVRSKLQSTYLLNEPSDPKVFCVSFLLRCFGPETNIQLLASTT